jgi:hypothetical protein
MRLYPREYKSLWHSARVVPPLEELMNLVVASRMDGVLMRFDVAGAWRNGDALKLAYMVKAAVARLRQDHVLIDLRQVDTPPEADGKFLICDRLRRALTPKTRVVLVATPELVDGADIPTSMGQCPDIALFDAEREAIDWLSLQ